MERRIVSCDPTGQDARQTARLLASVGIGSIICSTPVELMAQLGRGAGALLLVKEVVAGVAMRPLAEYMASQPTWSDIPVLLMTQSGCDLLDIAGIPSGKVVLKKSHITRQSVVKHAVEISSSTMEWKKHQLDVLEPEAQCVLITDHARLVLSVANLLVNAAKFTPRPGHIVLRAIVLGNTVEFTVRDNGIGLEPASIARIFDLFAQNPVSDEAPTGLGIGLNLARQFAEMQGGTLHATSQGLGKGSEFVLRLPVVVQTSLPAIPESSIDRDMMENMKSRKILVVDDNVDAADTLEALLCMDGFEVTMAYDGIAAVAAAESTRPDVVVMDIGMPGMDGYDAARRMRQQPGGQDMVLIALTGWGQSTDKNRANDAGFDHHLVKPVDYDILMSCLQVRV